MAEWAFVENNEIKELHDKLPLSWRNISGLNLASVDFLKSVGWLPVRKVTVEYNEMIHKVNSYSYTVSDFYVEEIPVFVEMNVDVAMFQEKKKSFMSNLRLERNSLLEKCDWTQLEDFTNISIKNQYKDYRQKLRDLPAEYENLEDYNTAVVAWPVKPVIAWPMESV
jgi:hypothetical protein